MAKFTCNFISYTFARSVDITVVIPSVTIPEILADNDKHQKNESGLTHKKQYRYPVLYLLHGWGNNHATWNAYTNIELFAEEQNIAVVMMSGENGFYVDYDSDNKYYTFIENELKDFVCGMFPVSDRPEDSYLAGLSMGGRGALMSGLLNPDKYRMIGAFSSPIEMDIPFVEKEKQNKFNLYSILNKIKNNKITDIYLACGEKDPFYEENRKFAQYLKDRGINTKWVSSPEYGHEWRFWDSIIEKFMKILPRTDAYAGIIRQI